MTPDALHQQFQEMLETVGTSCHCAESPAQAASIIAGIVDASSNPDRIIWTAPMVRDAMPDLVTALGAQSVEIRYPESPADVRDQPVGLSVAARAIAETGSVVLVERKLDDRAVGLMTETHIVVCRDGALAASLDDAAETLSAAASQPGSYATLVLSLIHISEPTRRTPISYAVFCLKKKK